MTLKKQIWSGKTLGMNYITGWNSIVIWGGFFCKTCKEGGGKYACATEGSTNIKILALQDHSKTVEHRKLAWTKHGGQKALQKSCNCKS